MFTIVWERDGDGETLLERGVDGNRYCGYGYEVGMGTNYSPRAALQHRGSLADICNLSVTSDSNKALAYEYIFCNVFMIRLGTFSTPINAQ